MSVSAYVAIECYWQEKFVFLNELYMSFSNAKIQYKQKNIYNIKTEIITWKLYKN